MSAPTGQFATTIADIRTGIDDAHQGARDIVTGIDHSLQLLPAGTPVIAVQAGIDELFGLLDDVHRQLADQLARAGDPDALRAEGAVWANRIGAGASRLAASTTLNGLQVDDHWTGTAATAYRNTLLPQNTALTAVKTAGDEIDAALNDLADAITTYWTVISTALLGLGVALVSAGWIAASGVGAPAAAGLGAAALAAFAGVLTAALIAVTAVANTAADLGAGLERQLSNDTAFPAGAWPRSVTSISGDGSISDGDDTDWHLA